MRRPQAFPGWALLVALLLLGSGVLVVADSAAGQEAPVCETATFTSADVPLDIPDSGTVESTLQVSAMGPVHDLDVSLGIRHPFDSDLLIELVSPSDTTVVLADSIGMWGDDFTDTVFDDEAPTSIVSTLPPYTGDFRSIEELLDFDLEERMGTWTLRVTDQRGHFTGSITAWGLAITGCATYVGPTDRTVERLPARCGPVGAPPLPPLPAGVPSGREEARGTVITVTTSSDEANGDESSVTALQANPGPDGVSLREAIGVTNNDPGEYTIRFDPKLAGATIRRVGEGGLPFLTGGGVFIDGDIDGNGDPDVTLTLATEAAGTAPLFGLVIASSGNRVHALTVEGFRIAVITAPPQDDPFVNNVLTGMVLEGPRGIGQHTDETPDSWRDTRIIGNTIRATRNGMEFMLTPASGDLVEGLTIANNRISARTGIQLVAGSGAGSANNRIVDAVVAHNSIKGDRKVGTGLRIAAGDLGATDNTVEDVRIVGNRVHLPGGGYFGDSGVSIIVGDAPSNFYDPEQPLAYPERNIARRILISGNSMTGQDLRGIGLATSCCGGGHNRMTEVRIENNEIDTSWVFKRSLDETGISIGAGNSGPPIRTSHDSEISNVTILANTIKVRRTPKERYLSLFTGGISAFGGQGSLTGRIEGLDITNNRVKTNLVGINLVGGGGFETYAAKRNVVTGAKVSCNVIAQEPLLFKSSVPRIKGINLIGGLGHGLGAGRAIANKVFCVRVKDNLVAGRLNKVSVFDNLGRGAKRNVARLDGC